MPENLPVKLIENQQWLEPVAGRLQSGVAAALDGAIGPTGAKFLHGTWLGHPLHVVLTDVPIGAWTTAAVFDLIEQNTPSRTMARGADAAITLGLCATAITAITGLADWSKIGGGRARRVGLMHGLLNTAASACYITSLCLRRNRSRAAGRQFAWLGLMISTVAAYLGGHLVYTEQLGVDHTAEFSPPEDFVPVLADSELHEGEFRRVEANGMPVLLARRGGHIYAIVEKCSHLGGPLSEGTFENSSVRCPWHGSCFSLEDGRVLEGPAVHPQPVLETRVSDGQIHVRGSRQ